MYYIITDTHFGHKILRDCFGRPQDYEHKILYHIEQTVCSNDVLIHLGDVCMGEDAIWHSILKKACKGKQWLIRGNHDKKSNSWYLSNGWDFVGLSITLEMYNSIILLSHKPQKDTGYDINIHGHFHNSDPYSHESALVRIKNNKHKLVMMEHEYRPYTLEELCMPCLI